MRVRSKKKVEGCIEGTNIYDLLLDDVISKEFILYLGGFGKLIYHESSAKPFFTVIVRGQFTLKGAQGNYNLRILLPENKIEDTLDEVNKIVELYNQN